MQRFISILCLSYLQVTHRLQKILTKSNEDLIKQYFESMLTEINPSINYERINRNTLNKLSRFHNNKPFMKMKREDIVAYLNSLKKSEDIDPLQMDRYL